MIVVTAPTGSISSQVIDALLADGTQPVRVVARDPGRLPAAVRDSVEVETGSHGDPQVLARALAGAHALFWLLPTDRTAESVDAAYSGFTAPVADVISGSGLRRVVDVTALGRGTAQAGRAGFVTASFAMDDLLAGTGIPFRGLAAAGFMDNLARQVAAIAGGHAFYDVLPPDRALPAVATRDIAATGARLLLDDAWDGRDDVPLLGPEDLSMADMAAIASDVLGFDVRYEQLDHDAFTAAMTGRGMSAAMAAGLLDMMDAKRDGLDNGVTRTAELARNTPTTFRRWCEDTLAPAVAAAAARQ